MEKLFQMYGRVDHKNQSLNSQGVGLGLTISNNLVKLLNGSLEKQNITVETKYGEGSTFSFDIQTELESWATFEETDLLEKEDGAHLDMKSFREELNKYETLAINNSSVFKTSNFGNLKQKYKEEIPSRRKKNLSFDFKNRKNPIEELDLQQRRSIPTNPSLYTPRSPSKFKKTSSILLVDDNPFNLYVAEQLILGYNYEVKTALTGQIAIDLAIECSEAQEDIKLILMDCQMPVLDGYETTKELKKLMKEKKIPHTPIVALTANNSLSDKKKCFESGMCDHLSKPLKDSDLKTILNKYI